MRRFGWTALVALVCACSSEVVADLDERQAQEALATLEGAGIPAERHATGEGRERRYRIDVPAKDAGRAAGVLRAQGLPRAPRRGFGELYGSASMIPTATEEKARYLEALGGEIAGHLEGLEGVLAASVIVTAPEDDPLAPPDAPRAHPTASVLVRLRPGAAAPADADVKKLVAGAVEGMAAADVAVVAVPAAALPAPGAPFASVGPIQVARGSKGALIGVLGVACGVIMLMGLWIILGERRAARLRLRLAERERR